MSKTSAHGTVQRVGQQIDLLESRVQQVTRGQDRHHDDGGADRRKGDVPRLPPPVGPVHPGRLIEIGINPGQRGEVDDGAPAHRFPQSLEDDQRAEPVRVGQKVEAGVEETIHQLGDRAGVEREQQVGQGGDDRPGQEVGDVNRRLDRPLQHR